MTSQHHPPTRSSGQLPTTAARAPGRGVTATWWYTFASMASFALALPLIVLVVQRVLVRRAGGASEALLVTVDVLLVLSAVAAIRGCFLIRAGLGSGWPRHRDALTVLVPPVLVWLLTLWLPGGAMTGALPLWVAMNVLVPLLERTGRRLVLTLGVVLYAAHWWLGAQLTGIDQDLRPLVSLLVFAVLCPMIFLFSAWWWDIVVELDAARRDAAQLAVARERLRFAADLHDIQGHHLQVIALKAELAERLLDRDRAAARTNIHEVRTLARTALEETRSIVRDLRAVSLEEELANAQDVLEAAGAATTLRIDVVDDPGARALLGVAVREAATNILRHSSASRVSIVLDRRDGDHVLVVENDGAASSRPGGPASGTGLAGLDRRFAAVGGSVTGRRDGDTHVLEAVLPAVPEGGGA